MPDDSQAGHGARVRFGGVGILCVSAGLLIGGGAFAQTPPAGGFGETRPSERPLPPTELQPEQPKPEFSLPPITPPAEEAPLSAAPVVFLQGVEFLGNTVFGEEELAALAQPYLNRSVSTEDLQRLRREITQLYIDRGYINSGAVIPDQEVIAGVVTFVIVEGVLSQIDVSGNERLRSSYIQDRLFLGSGPPLNVNDLQERIQLVLQDPLVDQIRARLLPGDRPGDSRLEVDVEESSPVVVQVSVANDRAPSIGEIEPRLDAVVRNLTGWGEALGVGLGVTEGLREVSAELSVPVTKWDTRVAFRFEDTEAEVVEEPFNDIDLESEARDYVFTISQPIYRTVGHEVSASVELARRETKTFLLGEPFSFSPGVEEGESVVTVVRFIQDGLSRGRNHVVAGRSTFSLGVDALDATSNSSSLPDGQFFSWLGQLQWAQRIEPLGIQTVLRGEAQLTPDRLLPLEKFSVGGANSVRGYREDQLVFDNGWAASLELRIPIFKLRYPGLSSEPDDGQIEFAPFFDIGQAWETDVSTPNPNLLYSVGAGLRWRLSEQFQASVYFGQKLKDIDEPDDQSLQDIAIHFQVSALFF